jgi:putative selenate reductase molybdopterin-binding subunit
MLLSGGTDLGTGLDTVTVKMVAEVLGTRMEDVAIIAADTDVTPFDTGAYASSGTYFSGGAAMNAAKKMRRMILEEAARILGEPEEGLEIVFPSKIKGRTRTLTFHDSAMATQCGTGRGQLTAHGNFITDKGSFPYGAFFAQVAVDLRTGKVTVKKLFSLLDAGTPINPDLALGQVYGGALKTLGHSLCEELVYDAEGHCLNPSFRDYRVPHIGDLPEEFVAELVDTDDPFGPFGAKSISEAACNGVAPAVASAIHDATGIWIRDWPFTPEKVLRALGKL